jgi:thiol-disulfide isomerase/thioredoxin
MAHRRGKQGSGRRGRRRGKGKREDADGGGEDPKGAAPKGKSAGRRKPAPKSREAGGSRRAIMSLGTIAAVLILVLAVGVSTDWFRGSFYDDDDDGDVVEFSGGGGADGGDDGSDGTDGDDGGGTGGAGDDGTGAGTDGGDGTDPGYVFPGDPGPRVVLVEDFSNTGCPPCAEADPDFDRAAANYGTSKVAYIRYHVWWPEAEDPFYRDLRDSDVRARATDKYSVSAVPSVFVDGKAVSFQADYYDDLVDAIDSRIDKNPAYLIEAGATAEDGEGHLEVTLTEVSPALYANRLHALLVETDIGYSASNGEEIHNYVVRGFIIPGQGEPVKANDAGKFTFDEDFDIPGDADMSNTWVVVFVQDQNGNTVHNAQVVDILDLG